jgi:hypothetical protein
MEADGTFDAGSADGNQGIEEENGKRQKRGLLSPSVKEGGKREKEILHRRLVGRSSSIPVVSN